MITPKMSDAINAQINAEMFSSYLYLSMSAWFSRTGLPGFSSWMRAQAKEEDFHAQKMFDYLLERGGKVELEAIDKPEINWESPLKVIEAVADHEAKVTSLINELVNCALDERDHASNIFLQWFVSEQVEEEASVGEVLDRMRLVGNDSAGMFAMDMEMSKRVFIEPVGK
ncbi:ferritin [Desulfosediminicola flagellatus]|uniref:ferritin n=1 Tax=Desulfosediminicola flagellatus TaxID=2569541 RepID=UPI0010ABCFE1|nr:ferritin [Desulfosediminicola flagellatus]